MDKKLTIKDVRDYYWSIPINLRSMAEAFEKAETDKIMEFIVMVLKDTVNEIEKGLELVGNADWEDLLDAKPNDPCAECDDNNEACPEACLVINGLMD